MHKEKYVVLAGLFYTIKPLPHMMFCKRNKVHPLKKQHNDGFSSWVQQESYVNEGTKVLWIKPCIFSKLLHQNYCLTSHITNYLIRTHLGDIPRWPCSAVQEFFNAFHIKTFESFLELSLGLHYEIITLGEGGMVGTKTFKGL